MNELAKKMLALARAHHNRTTFEHELRVISKVHKSWDEVARRFYHGMCEAYKTAPRPELAPAPPPMLRIMKGGTGG